jgi:hypothetical protein
VYRVSIRMVNSFNERFDLASMAASSDNGYSADFEKLYSGETGRLSSLGLRLA